MVSELFIITINNNNNYNNNLLGERMINLSDTLK